MGDAVQRSFRKRKYGNSERVQHLEKMLDPTPAINQLARLISQPIKVPSSYVHFPQKQKSRNFFSAKEVFPDDATYRAEVSKLFNTSNIDGDRSQVLSLMLDDSDTDDGGEPQPLTLKNLRQMLKIHKKRRALQTKCHEDPLNTQYKYYGAGLFSSKDKFPEHQKEVIDAFTYDFEAERRIFEEIEKESRDQTVAARDTTHEREFAARLAKAEADRVRREEEAAAEGREVSSSLLSASVETPLTEEEREEAVLCDLYLHLYHLQNEPTSGEYTQADLSTLYQKVHEMEQARDARREEEKLAKEAMEPMEHQDEEHDADVNVSEHGYPEQEIYSGGDYDISGVAESSEGGHGESEDVEQQYDHFDDDQDNNQDDQMDETMNAVFEHITNSEQGGFLVDSLMTEFDEMAAAAPDGQVHFNLEDDDTEEHGDYEATESEQTGETEVDQKSKVVTPDVFEHYDTTWDASAKPFKTPSPETIVAQHQEVEEHAIVEQKLGDQPDDVEMKEASSHDNSGHSEKGKHEVQQPSEEPLPSEAHVEVASLHLEELCPHSESETPLDLSKPAVDEPGPSGSASPHRNETPASIEASRQGAESVESPSQHLVPVEFTPPGSDEYHCVAMDYTDNVNVFNPLAATASQEPEQGESSNVPRGDASLSSDDDVPGISIGDSDEDFDLDAFVAENHISVVGGSGVAQSSSAPTPGASGDPTPTLPE